MNLVIKVFRNNIETITTPQKIFCFYWKNLVITNTLMTIKINESIMFDDIF